MLGHGMGPSHKWRFHYIRLSILLGLILVTSKFDFSFFQIIS